MTTLKSIYQELDSATSHMYNGVDAEDYERNDKFLREYIETGKKNFSHTWKNDFLDREFTLFFNVEDLLSNRKRIAFKNAKEFLDNPNEPNYKALIDSFYPLILSSILYYRNNSKLEFDKNELVLFFFISLAYYPESENQWLFKALNNYIIQDDVHSYNNMDAKNTLFPLAYNLANECVYFSSGEYSSLITNGIDKFSFNSLYDDTYRNYTSENEMIVNKIFDNMCKYHLKKSIRTDDYYSEFEYSLYQAIPCEILVLLVKRSKQELDNGFIDNPLINKFIPFISQEFNYTLSDENNVLRSKIFNDYGLL